MKLRSCVPVRNITVSVADDTYRAARIAAAERDCSVSALVAAYLASLSNEEQEFARLEAEQHRVQAEIRRFRGADRLTRNEVHERALP